MCISIRLVSFSVEHYINDFVMQAFNSTASHDQQSVLKRGLDYK